MSTEPRGCSGGDGAPPSSLSSAEKKQLIVKCYELQVRIDQLIDFRAHKRCHRNPSFLMAHCSLCQTKEPGHGVEAITKEETQLLRDLMDLQTQLRPAA